jgi:argonaute-like protein implicated in RNA metabolism and viral defense
VLAGTVSPDMPEDEDEDVLTYSDDEEREETIEDLENVLKELVHAETKASVHELIKTQRRQSQQIDKLLAILPEVVKTQSALSMSSVLSAGTK